MAEREDEESTVEASLEELLQRKAAERPAEEEDDEVLDLGTPGEDGLSADALEVKALPVQENEFTCSRCFLVHHVSQLADARKKVCRDCV